MYLFFDTETTGLPKNWKAPVSDVNNWPRMVQLAWLSFDSQGNKTGGSAAIIKPVGFTIPYDVSKVHGISNERALKEGMDLLTALNDFRFQVERANHLVAHNISFDEKIVGAEFLRNAMTNPLETKRKICTMTSSKNYVGLEGPYGFKYPKLSELHFKLFGTSFGDAHNAEVDIEITAKCFWELKRIGVI